MSTEYFDSVDNVRAEWTALWERRHRFAWVPRTNKVERKGYRKMREGQPE